MGTSVRAEAVRPCPVEVETTLVGDSERGLKMSEHPCSTVERAVSVEPVGKIAMAERSIQHMPQNRSFRRWTEDF